uniref:Uncharacterized protein n=1 Tax=Kalanchoe fedtschenkoi TaxID=63787 RepID=A0A7N0TDV8_KALFE
MEALWRLEDKWNLSTHGAVILFICAASLLMGVCAATVLKRRSAAKRDRPARPKWSETGCICSWGGSMKRVLMGSVRWCAASKWGEQNVAGTWQDGPSPSPLLGRGKQEEEEKGPASAAAGLQSHNSESPVWQRPILMGEKCEMPRFSGLILYDERGQPLHRAPKYVADINKQVLEKTPAAARTTLRDLL